MQLGMNYEMGQTSRQTKLHVQNLTDSAEIDSKFFQKEKEEEAELSDGRTSQHVNRSD